MSARALVFVAALLAPLATARAQSFTPTLHAEGGAQLTLGDAYSDRFDLGAGGALRAGLELLGPLAIQVGFGTAWFPVAGQEPGTLYSLELGLRAFFRVHPAIGGPFIDANAGAGITGDLFRVVFDVGLGWDFFPVRWLGLGPVARYQQIVQPDDQGTPEDARILLFGVNFTVRIERDPEPRAPASTVPRTPADTDGDGVRDDADRCADRAEDLDGIDDADGCPEDDADGDGLADAADACPRAAEVRNDFQDDDGCPDEAPRSTEVVTNTVTEREHGEPLAPELHFRVGTDRVSPRERPMVLEVCRIVSSRPGTRVRVIGHADEQGTRAGNARLGAERAGAAAEQLVLCGIAPERIESASYGDAQPSCSRHDEVCHQRNRRVTFELFEASAAGPSGSR